MEWQPIISSGIQHLAWPITVLVIAFALKNKVPDISKVKVKDVEVEFERTVNAIRKDAKASSSGSWQITSTSSLMPKWYSGDSILNDRWFCILSPELRKEDKGCNQLLIKPS
jgi:hypothetical protein